MSDLLFIDCDKIQICICILEKHGLYVGNVLIQMGAVMKVLGENNDEKFTTGIEEHPHALYTRLRNHVLEDKCNAIMDLTQ